MDIVAGDQLGGAFDQPYHPVTPLRMPAIRRHGLRRTLLAPIHPIDSTTRKGRNNSLEAAPGHPGSPYAIGSEEGGHHAIHPELGDSRISAGWSRRRAGAG